MFKKLSQLTLVFLMGVFLLSSCSKENIDVPKTVDNIDPIVTNIVNGLVNRSDGDSDGEGLEMDCITLGYPFGMVDSEGNEHQVNDFDEFISLLENSDSTVYIMDFIYPLTVETEDGLVEVADAVELGELFLECTPEGGWDEDQFPAYLIDESNSCYSFEYPISVSRHDGSIETANTEVELVEILAQDIAFFVFPFNLIDEDAQVFTVNDVDQLFSLLTSCSGLDIDSTDWDWDEGFEYIGCYQIDFPFNVELADGSVVVVNSHQELCDLMLQGEIAGYAFPMTLIDDDGTTIVVNNEDELNEALEDCGIIVNLGDQDLYLLIEGTPAFGGNCYDIVFPISGTFINKNGDTASVVFENYEAILTFNYEVQSLDYPITVTMLDDGATVELDSVEDLFILLDGCW